MSTHNDGQVDGQMDRLPVDGQTEMKEQRDSWLDGQTD